MELMLNPSEKDDRLLMYLSLRMAFFEGVNSDLRKSKMSETSGSQSKAATNTRRSYGVLF
jgi:hypothetical protein